MSTQKNIEVVRLAFKEVFDRRNVAVVDDLYAADYVYHSPGTPDLDREGLKKGFSDYLAAFPDAHMVLEDIFGAGDKVTSRFICDGTHLGTYSGVPATQKPTRLTAIIIHRLVGGKIVEDWEWSDRLGMLQQLGIVQLDS